jgi:hypothetical protein
MMKTSSSAHSPKTTTTTAADTAAATEMTITTSTNSSRSPTVFDEEEEGDEEHTLVWPYDHLGHGHDESSSSTKVHDSSFSSSSSSSAECSPVGSTFTPIRVGAGSDVGEEYSPATSLDYSPLRVRIIDHSRRSPSTHQPLSPTPASKGAAAAAAHSNFEVSGLGRGGDGSSPERYYSSEWNSGIWVWGGAKGGGGGRKSWSPTTDERTEYCCEEEEDLKSSISRVRLGIPTLSSPLPYANRLPPWCTFSQSNWTSTTPRTPEEPFFKTKSIDSGIQWTDINNALPGVGVGRGTEDVLLDFGKFEGLFDAAGGGGGSGLGLSTLSDSTFNPVVGSGPFNKQPSL